MDQPIIANTAPTLKPLTWPPIHVEARVPPDKMHAMLQRVEAIFNHLGKTEPYWSVLTTEKYLTANIAETKEEFYESGKRDAERMVAFLARNGYDAASFRTCFELGCGVGRTSIWLSRIFNTVISTDISAPHLVLAKRAAEDCPNIRFRQIRSVQDISDTPDFDFFFSEIVLQHNPPPIIRAILSGVFNRLPPGGLAYFQVPTYRLGYQFVADDYLAAAGRLDEAEMHVLPQPELHDLIVGCRCRIVEMREDGAAGGQHISSRLLVRKL